jgi:hypothetical protein
VLHEGAFHVVADDENALFVIYPDAGTRRIRLLPGELPTAHKKRKKHKPDFEILVDLADAGLLAMGSGSRPTRERAVRVHPDEHTTVIDTSALCACLRETFRSSTSRAACWSGTNWSCCNGATAATSAPR